MSRKISSRKFYPLLFVTLYLLTAFYGVSRIVVQGKMTDTPAGFTAPRIPINSTVDLHNGQIESFWSLIDTYQNVSEYGNYTQDNYVKFANNDTHLFALFTTLSTNEWISVEFEPNPYLKCMANLNDGWTFYIEGNTNTVEARDVNFLGTVIPSTDTNNDLSIESIFSGDLVFIEVVRQFDTQDTAGYDIVYSNGSFNTLQFATNGHHFDAHNIYYLFLTDTLLGGEIVIEEPTDIPTHIVSLQNQVDLNQVKFVLIGITPIGVLGFMFIHFLRRVYSSPIQHGYVRISNESKSPPSFRERWNETFSSGKD